MCSEGGVPRSVQLARRKSFEGESGWLGMGNMVRDSKIGLVREARGKVRDQTSVRSKRRQ